MTREEMNDVILGWRYCSEELPPEVKPGEEIKEYLICTEDGFYGVLRWCNGWNNLFLSDGTLYTEGEVTDVFAWIPIEPPSRKCV